LQNSKCFSSSSMFKSPSPRTLWRSRKYFNRPLLQWWKPLGDKQSRFCTVRFVHWWEDLLKINFNESNPAIPRRLQR
jgi:hypothetical protein